MTSIYTVLSTWRQAFISHVPKENVHFCQKLCVLLISSKTHHGNSALYTITYSAFVPNVLDDLECGQVVSGYKNDSDTIWYSFTIDDTYTVTFTDCGSMIDPELRVYDDDGNWISQTVCGDNDGNDCNVDVCDSGFNHEETFNLTLSAGTFYIALNQCCDNDTDVGNWTLRTLCLETNSFEIWSDLMNHSDPTQNGWTVDDNNGPGFVTVITSGTYCPLFSKTCTALSGDINMDMNITLNDSYYDLSLTYSIISQVIDGKYDDFVQCAMLYYNHDEQHWKMIQVLNGTGDQWKVNGIFTFPPTERGVGYIVNLRLEAVSGFDDSCYFQHFILDGYLLDDSTDEPTVAPSGLSTS